MFLTCNLWQYSLPMIIIKKVSEQSELKAIRILQQNNLTRNLAPAEAAAQGFVTAEYSLDFLEKMHNQYPSIIAKEDKQVAGYILAATKSIRFEHDLLADLFNVIDETKYKNQSLKDARYVIAGQVCVAKNYRGLGLVQRMYQEFRNSLSKDFDYCLTDVADDNPRSLKAHLKSGFRIIDTLTYGGLNWQIILWDWR
jgi:hypothetical protein